MQRACHTSKPNPRGHYISNRRLLSRVRRAIVKDPYLLNMDDFISPGPYGASLCIATLALHLAGRNVLRFLDPYEAARKVLGMTREAAEALFVVSGWPADLQRRYVFDPTTRRDYIRNATLAARRIQQLIEAH